MPRRRGIPPHPAPYLPQYARPGAVESTQGAPQIGRPLNESVPTNLASTERIPFDVGLIRAVPANGATVPLINGPVGTIPPAQLQRPPAGFVGIVTQYATYLETTAGVIRAPGRIPNQAGSVITWRLNIGGRPSPYHGNVTWITAEWGNPGAGDAFIMIPSQLTLTVTVTYQDPGALYGFIGCRLRGYFRRAWPIDRKAASK